MIDLAFTRRQGGFSLDVDLRLPARGIVGLSGRSGSGKSTLLACIAGHQKPASGHIRLDNRTLFDSATRTNLAPASRGIGVVFQDALLFPHLSVRRNLTYGAPRGTCPVAIAEALEITELLDARPRHLSGGEAQRVAIGRALMAAPRLLLLDEPVSALDPGLRARTLDLIARVQAETGTPMVYVSHAPEEMQRLCDTVVTLSCGRLLGTAPHPAPALIGALPCPA
jgi:molybdate transport system ATP-binding protein